jgi:ubiquinone/menaquinone biosynthesis C-methylase UbiE
MSGDLREDAKIRLFYEEFHRDAIPPLRVPAENDFAYAWVIKALKPLLAPGVKFLDVGCGLGEMALFVAARGITTVGVDVSARAMEAAALAARRLGLSETVEFRVGQLHELNLSESSFDVILCNQVLEHVPDDGAFLRRLRALLAPKGAAVITVPSAEDPTHRFRKWRRGKDEFDECVGHLRRYTTDEFRALLRQNGFAVERLHQAEGPLRGVYYTCPSGAALRKIFRGPLRKLMDFADFWLLFVFAGGAHVATVRKSGP